MSGQALLPSLPSSLELPPFPAGLSTILRHAWHEEKPHMHRWEVHRLLLRDEDHVADTPILYALLAAI